MKVNLPVTQTAVPLPVDTLLVSKTDLKGIITYANDAFVDISGFTRDELIGKSHNLVRHPDMPPQAFADLWQTVKAGRAWKGIVKNRCKSGDFYWVEATVIPVTKNGEIIGYMSSRTTPTRQQVSDAETLYRQLRESKAALPRPRKTLSLKGKLLAFAFAVAALVGSMGLLAIQDAAQHRDTLTAAYSEHADPALALHETLALMDGAYKHAVLAVMHDPAGPYAKQHAHPITQHLDSINQKIDALRKLRKSIGERHFSDTDKATFDALVQTGDRYIDQGLTPIKAALQAGQFGQAAELTESTLFPLYEAAKKQAKTLNTTILAEKDAAKQAAQTHFAQTRQQLLGVSLLCLLLVGGMAWWIIRSITRPLQTVTDHFRRISEGVLTDTVDIHRQDEIGTLMCSLAVMQTNLKVMLDNINTSSKMLLQSSADLDAQMFMVTMQSDSQQREVESVAATTEEFSQAVAEVAGSAQQTAEYAQSAEQLVSSCGTTIASSLRANEQVISTVNNSSEIIGRLGSSIRRIGDVTKAIREIADQTNLLALNAAIEAARAGEAGRGFAVVADEVRKLSEHTANSTRDITNVINEIQSISEQAVQAMHQAVSEVTRGDALMQAGAQELSQLTASSQAVNGMAQHIASAAQQQSVAGQSVASSMVNVAAMVEQNASVAQQATQLSKDLLKTANRLKKTLVKFQLFLPSEVPPVAASAPRGHTQEFIEL